MKLLLKGISIPFLFTSLLCFGQKFPYQNSNVPLKQRVADLMGRMSLEEKIAQMSQFVGIGHLRQVRKEMEGKPLKANDDANAFYPGLSITEIEKMTAEGKIGSFLHVVTAKEANYLQALAQKSRLKIPLLIGIDAIHGNALVSGCTVYPSPIGLSCSWDTVLVKKIAGYTAKEMKSTGSQWAFAPNLDIARDPRWGRTGETFGEDPFMVSCFGAAYINGLQQHGVVACAKHLIGGSQSVNGLNKAPTDISERTLYEIFLPPYEAAVRAGIMSVMPAHNELNGIPGHANKLLMQDLMRKQLGFSGFYVSDWMDIERMVELHQTVPTAHDAIYASLNAGMDMHMHGPGFKEVVIALVKAGKLSESRIDTSVSRILEVKFRAGLFEQPFVAENTSELFTDLHRKTALEVAEKSVVLLKNTGLLPLKVGAYKKILVTGPNANNQAQLGDWSLEQPTQNVITIYQGVKQIAKNSEVCYADCGEVITGINQSGIDKVVAKAKDVDLVVLVIGDNSLRFQAPDRTAGENVDRDDISLPGLQEQLAEALYRTGKPVIVVMVNGRPLAIPWLQQHMPAIIEAWEPGSMGGLAVANILFGNTNPSGKLTVSMLRNIGQIGNYYNHKPSQYALNYLANQTGPLYPFGFGLSYTSFAYGDIQLDKQEINTEDSLTVTIAVTNTGKIAGDAIIQLYLKGSMSSITKPVKELKDFKRVSLKSGETRKIIFRLPPDVFKSYNAQLKKVIEPGVFTIMVGSSSRDEDLKFQKVKITS